MSESSAAPTLINCTFIGNSAGANGGGFYCSLNGMATLDHCVFHDNEAGMSGGGIGSDVNASATIINCTISDNQSPYGGGIFLWGGSITLENTIISFSSVGESVGSFGGTVDLMYCDVYGNEGGDWVGPIAGQFGINGNISDDPLYVDRRNGDYHLTEDSPCIDAGNPASPYDPDGTVADMGAFYFHQGSGIGDEGQSERLTEYRLNPAYPNPFNPTTTISFQLPVAGFVTLEIFDVNGRAVGARHAVPLQNAWHPAGTHEVTFDGSGLASGLYIYRIQTGDYTASGKMVLMK